MTQVMTGRKIKEFIGVMHRHTEAGFKRLDQAAYNSHGFRLWAEYDVYSHNVSVISWTRTDVTEDEKDSLREFINTFENNKMRFE